ncbi:MAG: sugar-binding protein [Limnochordia bacterium]|nr:hypothetical protein [Limnochordia bacterium]MDD2630587.1 sugar-binding protein [Limnochordia bacterium]MDD4517972.1 sugar-binding protein [Limnochordia bacterium]
MKKSMLALTILIALLGLSVTVLAMEPNLELIAAKVTEKPEIDGFLNDAAWVQASEKGAKVVMDLDSTSVKLTSYPIVTYVAYDDNALYVGYSVFVPDASKIKTDGEKAWQNDEVELFLKVPSQPDYRHICVDAGGKIGVDDSTYQEDPVFAGKIDCTVKVHDVRWIAELAIPFEAFGVTPKKGDTWKIGLCGYQSVGDFWLTWNATYGGFHNEARFGTLVFGD